IRDFHVTGVQTCALPIWPTPLEAILAAVAGCFGTIGRFIAHQQKIELRGMQFEIEADYDPAGLLGRDPSVRPGFQELRVKVDIRSEERRGGKGCRTPDAP